MYTPEARAYICKQARLALSLSLALVAASRRLPLALRSRVLCVKLQNVRGLARVRCNADHTSIHWKWTSIPVINTSRLSTSAASSPRARRAHSSLFRSLSLSPLSVSLRTLFLSRFHWTRSVVVGFFLSLSLSLSMPASLSIGCRPLIPSDLCAGIYSGNTRRPAAVRGISAANLHVSDTHVGGSD